MSDRVVLGALVAAVAAAAVWIQASAPAALLARPERAGRPDENARVQMEAPEYPRYATGADDVRVRIERAPRRIISKYWSVDEFLYALVPPERVVGVSETAYSGATNYNLGGLLSRHKPVVASNPEVVFRAQPDLVLTGESESWETTSILRHAGVPVYRVFTSFETLQAIEDHIRLLGYLTGEDARAQDVLEAFQTTVARAAARRPEGAPAPRVLAMSGAYSYGSQTLMDDVLRVLGAENVAAAHGLVGYSRATDEHIVRWDPDWILIGAARGREDAMREELLARPALRALADMDRRLVVIPDDLFLAMSPQTARLVEHLAEVLYGAGSGAN